MANTYLITVLDNDDETATGTEFTSEATNLIDAIFEYECHKMSPYLDELVDDEDTSDLTDELTRMMTNIKLSTKMVGDTAYRLADDETGWICCKLQ